MGGTQWFRGCWGSCAAACQAEGRTRIAGDFLCKGSLQRVSWCRRQSLVWGETTQLEVIIHGDVGSQHLEVQVFHCLWWGGGHGWITATLSHKWVGSGIKL